jgi:hypothetical protein
MPETIRDAKISGQESYPSHDDSCNGYKFLMHLLFPLPVRPDSFAVVCPSS